MTVNWTSNVDHLFVHVNQYY